MALVAVYGTLKSGLHNHSLLENAVYVGTTVAPEIEIYDLHGMFPVAKRCKLPKHLNEFPPVIEVYEVDSKTMIELDILEGVCYGEPEMGLYHKDYINTEFGECVVYIYNDSIDGLNKIINWGVDSDDSNFESYVSLKINKINAGDIDV